MNMNIIIKESLKMNKKEKLSKQEQLLNLFQMIREFDYARNGKEKSIEFLEYVIEAFKSY